MSPTYGHVTKLFSESEFKYKGNEQMENREFSQNLAVFLARTDSEIKLFEYYTEKDKKGHLSSLGQDPTFKAPKNGNN